MYMLSIMLSQGVHKLYLFSYIGSQGCM